MADEVKPITDEVKTEPATEPVAPTVEEKTEQVQVEEVKPEEVKTKIVPGMVVRVHVKIKDITPKGDERERIQVFEGTVIAKKGCNPENASITVRKVSGGVGVERIFPLRMPMIDKIEVVKKYKTRRAKLYHLRGKHQKKQKEESK